MTSDLIAKLEALNGPDRAVDAHMHAVAIGGRVHYIGEGEATIERPIDGMWIRQVLPLRSRKIPSYTASLDAAIALVERVLPGWSGDVDIGKPITDSGKQGARLFPPEPGWTNYAGDGATPAIALLIALLRAKEARDAEC